MQSRTLIMDGAYGTNLPKGTSPEVYNIENPALVEALHSEYAKYADILKTNTFNVGVGEIIKSITENTVDIALSGLLAGALRVMQGSVEVIRKHSSLPIFLGGAVVSEHFVQEHIKEKDVFYTTDGLSLAALLDSRSIKHE